MLRRKLLGAFLAYAILFPTAALAQSSAVAMADSATTTKAAVYTAPKATIDKIKDEGFNRSQVMQTLSYLTDVIGPRLTNSPNMKRANEWTRDTMAKWGMQNAKLAPWGPWGRGWSLKSFSASVIEPQLISVIAYPKAWSPSTKGAVTSDIVYLDIRSDDDFAKYKGQLKDKIVFVSRPRELKAAFDPMGERMTDEQLAKLAAEPDPATRPQPQFGQNPQAGQPTPEQQERIRQFQLAQKAATFVFDEGAAIIVDNSRA
ncbi:MAG TPA: hypothetical protein VJL58_10705, partial [Pyrinomonadaceae bacterium]|nr:hypothetical protein [Pyrinomonadaceae bacterium]